MKAAVFYKKHDMRVEEIHRKEPGPDDVLIKVQACGICGTDIHIYEGAEGSTKVTPPLVLGHEFSGVVEAAGRNITDIGIGDRVCVDPNIMCGKCYFCRKGQEHFCENHIGVGTTVDGAFAEYITICEKQVYKIPDNLTYEEVAMAEPISCCLNGIDLTGIKTGDTVLVIGGGTIGLIMLQLVVFSGAGSVILIEPVKWKRDLAGKLGADIVINPFNDNIDDVFEDNSIRNVERVFECVGSVNTMEAALEYAGRGASVMLFGLTPPSSEIRIRPYDIFRKELKIGSSFINPYTVERSIKLLASGRVRVKDIITDEIGIDDIVKVFEDSTYRDKGKIIVKPYR